MTKKELAPGININNDVIEVQDGVIETLMEREIRLDSIANTRYESIAGGIARFIVASGTKLVPKKKADVTNNGLDPMSFAGIAGTTYDLPLNNILDPAFQFSNCQTHQVSPELAQSQFKNVAVAWQEALVQAALDEVKATMPAHTVDASELTILDTIENMILKNEQLGFPRASQTVVLSAKAASAANKLGLATDSLEAKEITPNTFGTAAVVNVLNRLGADCDVAVYVKDFVVVGSGCTLPLAMENGTGPYRGRTLISGQLEFGAGVIEVNAAGADKYIGSQYAIPVDSGSGE